MLILTIIKNMNTLICFLFICFFSVASYSQTFTRITSGDIVTDNVMSWGCACADYNNDGYIDVFVGNAETNSLYLNNGDGTFTKITTGPIVNDGGSSRGGSWGDYNNDGFLDLFVPNNGSDNFLYRNDGAPSNYTFTKITDGDIVNDDADSRGASWGDIDNDGFIDMFVAREGNNFFYRNNGNNTFTKKETGNIVNDGATSIGPTWCDYNNDGFIDLYVANMGEVNFFYKNNGDGSFTRITDDPFGSDAGAGAGGSWGDFNNNGFFDLFVANAPGTNFFYINNGLPDYTFTKVITGSIAADAGVSYGSTWADFDNNGNLDMFVANNDGANFYYRNLGLPDYNFEKILDINIATDGGASWGSCVADFNNDGHIDIFIANTNVNFLYLNDGNSNSWINIKLNGVASNNAAIGTRVLAKATINGMPRWQSRDVVGQTSYYSQGSLNVHFGFGDAAVIDSLIIKWPSSITDVYTNVVVNQLMNITEQIPSGFLKANFIVDNNFSIHEETMTVQFSDLSIADSLQPITSWEWDLTGDGVINSTLQDPEWAYTQPGVYTVSLKVSNGSVTNELKRTNYINFVGEVPIVSMNTETVLSGPYPVALDSVEIGFTVYNIGSATDSISALIDPRNVNPPSAINIRPELFLLEPGDSQVVNIVFKPNQVIPPYPPFFRYSPVAEVESFRGYGQQTFQKQFLITLDTAATSVNPEDLPSTFSLSQNYPNPFNPATNINFSIAEPGFVKLAVYNILGEEVKLLVNELKEIGVYTISFDASSLPSGVYFYKIETPQFNQTRKMILAK